MGRWFIMALGLVVLTTGCGKNDAVRAVGNVPYDPGVSPVVPVPPSGPVTPSQPGNQGPGYFNPQQVPQNQGQRFYPFMPVYSYYQQNAKMQQYWQQLWYSWQYYARYYNYDQYDFRYFWLDYCPQVMNNSQTYNQLDYYFYQNVGYQSYFSETQSSYYWQNYNGFSFSDIYGYGY